MGMAKLWLWKKGGKTTEEKLIYILEWLDR
jgi:hypothetical protein